MNIKNIIFDLGGVLLNIDYQLTSNAFKQLGIKNFDNLYAQAKQSRLFDDIETGNISPIEFFNKLRIIANINNSDQEIEKAWNAMLLDLPKERIELLKKVSTNYNIFLLSNTNEIHYNFYMSYIKKEFNIDFNSLFNQTYYSHQIGKRKPNASCFNFVIERQDLIAEESLFIDDSVQHIDGARQLGINTHHLTNKTILDLFDKDGILVI